VGRNKSRRKVGQRVGLWGNNLEEMGDHVREGKKVTIVTMGRARKRWERGGGGVISLVKEDFQFMGALGGFKFTEMG